MPFSQETQTEVGQEALQTQVGGPSADSEDAAEERQRPGADVCAQLRSISAQEEAQH